MLSLSKYNGIEILVMDKLHTKVSSFPLKTSPGVTLVEALVALAVFLVVVVPMISFAFRDNQSRVTEVMLTAACILEQEAARVRRDPAGMPPSKTRTIQGEQWTIECEKEGADLFTFKITVKHPAGKRFSAVYMAHGKDRQ